MKLKDLFIFNKKHVPIYIILIIICIALNFLPEPPKTENTPKEDPALISVAKYGENYPYTIDNLKLKCENDAVWVEDSALNKYALNGLANGKFQGRGDYKGYTNGILKENKNEADILSKGLEFCK